MELDVSSTTRLFLVVTQDEFVELAHIDGTQREQEFLDY